MTSSDEATGNEDGLSAVKEMDALIDGMTDDELKEWHQKKCKEEEWPGEWEHAFVFFIREDTNGLEWESMENPRRRVVNLFEKQNWQQMGEYIGYNQYLDHVDLSGCNMERYAEDFFASMRPYRCPMEVLCLNNNGLGDRGARAMLPFLKVASSLKLLDLSKNNLGNEGARLISEALDHVSIKILGLNKNGIGTEGVGCILGARNSKDLVELYLDENCLGYGEGAVEPISSFLGRNDIALKKLIVRCLNANQVKLLLDSISNGSKLEELLMIKSDGRTWVPPPAALQSLQKKICNLSSFASLCQSNYFLRDLGPDLSSFLIQNWGQYDILRSAWRITCFV